MTAATAIAGERTIARVRSRPGAALLCALVTAALACLPAAPAGGRTPAPARPWYLRSMLPPFAGTGTQAQAPGAAPAPSAALGARPRAAAARARLASSRVLPNTLTRLRRAGAIGEAEYLRYAGVLTAAQHTLGRLGGTRAVELGSVLANIQAIAAAGALSPSRLPSLFLTLERNRSWWAEKYLLSSGSRVSFPGSLLVWEYYPGQGIEIQWLATFGEANGYYLSGHANAQLRQVLDEALALASSRAGGISWDYLFQFDGGRPPWTSGLSQGTAVQAFARGYERLHEPAFQSAAQRALSVFEAPPPTGVRVSTSPGSEYAEYSYAPTDRILNGFIQSLVGLYDYTAITGDPRGLALFEAGDARARAIVPRYDTGAWSLYDQYGESSLSYHELLQEFLLHLCQRTRKGPPAASAPPPPGSPPAPTGTTPAGGTGVPTGSGGSSGGTTGGASAAARTAAAPSAQIPGDGIYCTTAEHFAEDLKAPPVVSLLSTKLRGGTRAGVKISLSKESTVTLIVRSGARTVWTNTATVEGGRPRLLFLTPRAGGTFSVTLSATDLAGNFSTAQGSLLVTRH